LAHAGVIAVFEEDGQERDRLQLPITLVTSLGFGGDGRDLFIVSGPEHHVGRETTGSVFHIRVEVPGVPARLARLAILGGDKEPEHRRSPAVFQGQPKGPVTGPAPLADEVCPRCGGPLRIGGSHDIAVLSRAAEVLVCGMCGTDEALIGSAGSPDEWPIENHHSGTLEVWKQADHHP
jgi:hypothetical protein